MFGIQKHNAQLLAFLKWLLLQTPIMEYLQLTKHFWTVEQLKWHLLILSAMDQMTVSFSLVIKLHHRHQTGSLNSWSLVIQQTAAKMITMHMK